MSEQNENTVEIPGTESVTTVGNTVSSLAEAAELVAYQDVKQALDKWTIPSVDPYTIYRKGKFQFLSRTIIKTFEHASCIQNNDEIIRLIHVNDFVPFLKDYKYIHIGLVQIAFKPLTLLGQNTSIQCTLKDGRCLNWRASIMGAIETSLSHGPVYFDIYPNLSVALCDANLSNVLELRVLTHGYNYKPGTPLFSVHSRIYIKALTTLNPYVKKKTETGQTVLIETNLYSSQVAVPKMIAWKDITFPDRWEIPNAVPPKPMIQHNIDDVIQTQGGHVYLQFQKPMLIRSNSSNASFRTAPRSFSNNSFRSVPSVPPYQVDYPESSRQSVDNLPSRRQIENILQQIPSRPPSRPPSDPQEDPMTSEIQGIRLSQNRIPHGVYTAPPVPTPSPDSPTASDMNFDI